MENVPRVDNYENNPSLNLRLNSKKVLFAKYLLQEKEKNHLPIFNELVSIMDPKISSTDFVASASSDVESSSSFDDFYSEKLENYMSKQNDEPEESINPANAKFWPPPLPSIPDVNLRHQVFTHKSVGTLYSTSDPKREIEVHNERLEFLGDSIANSLLAIISYENLPTVDEGDLTRCRRQLISNNTFAEWSKLYGLDKKLMINDKYVSYNRYVVGGRNSGAGTPKFVADTFEAYVGGLWVYYANKHGVGKAFEMVKPWLEQLAQPFFEAIYASGKAKRPAKKQFKIDTSSKKGFNPENPIQIFDDENVDETTEKIVVIDDETSDEKAYTNSLKLPDEIKTQDIPKPKDASNKVDNTNSLPNVSNVADPFATGLYISDKSTEKKQETAKRDLYSKIGIARSHPVYKVIRTEPSGEFTVACIMEGETIGVGTARTIKAAGNMAAFQALNNADIILKYASKRRVYYLERDEHDKIKKPITDEPEGLNNSTNTTSETKDRDLSHSTQSESKSDKSAGDSASLVVTGDKTPTPKEADIVKPDPSLTAEMIDKFKESPLQSLITVIGPKLASKIKYDFQTEGSVWHCTLSIDSHKFCKSTGSSKKSSKKKAALATLVNCYSQIKDLNQ